MSKWTAVLASAFAVGVTMSACSAPSHCADGAVCGTDSGSGDGHSSDGASHDGNGDGSIPQGVVSVAISPANATLMSNNGSQPTQTFTLVGTRGDGTTTTITAVSWTVDNVIIGSIDSGNGLFTANGAAGGTVVVHASTQLSSGVANAQATMTVKLTRVVLGTGAPADSEMRFMNGHVMAGSSEAPNLRYPLDHVRMPNNVAPPDIQWANGSSGDLYRITLSKPNSTVTAYIIHSGGGFAYHWLVDSTAWLTILGSDPDSPATLTVDRWQSSSSNVYTGTPIEIQVAHGSVFGSVYYWDLNPANGISRIYRINAVTALQEDFMPRPPVSPDGGRNCVACHSISQDGRYLGGQLGEGGSRSGTVFDLTTDLSGTPATSVYAPSHDGFGPSSFNPDSTRMVVSSLPGLGIIDPMNGMSVTATGLPTGNANHPAWSPDGNSIAYIHSAQQYSWEIAQGDLMVLPRTGADAFAAPMMVHQGTGLGSGLADVHPSWSPDSQMLAFASGTTDGSSALTGSLYVVSHSGGTPAHLSRAMSGTDGEHSFWPTFSPFVTPEPSGVKYYWLAYYDRRDYGNAQAGTAGTNRRQLWVTAVDSTGAGDPSSVPYWLSGQAVSDDNAAAYWAPSPCRQNGSTCSSSSVCCSGNCLPGTGGMLTCQPPPMSQCRTAGQTCSGMSDCCNGLQCFGNVCVTPPG